MSKYTKRGRVMLNDSASGCLAAVAWVVHVVFQKDYDYETDTDKKTGKWKASGSIILNEEAKEHYVHRKGCLRSIRRMQKQLNMFEAAMTQAFVDAEAANNATS